MRIRTTRFVKAATIMSLGALAAVGGCSSSAKSAQVYTYDAASGGNFIAADALGARMMRAETYRQATLIQHNNLASVRE